MTTFICSFSCIFGRNSDSNRWYLLPVNLYIWHKTILTWKSHKNWSMTQQMKIITKLRDSPSCVGHVTVVSRICICDKLPAFIEQCFIHSYTSVRSHILEFLTSDHFTCYIKQEAEKVDTVFVNLKSLILGVKEVYYTVWSPEGQTFLWNHQVHSFITYWLYLCKRPLQARQGRVLSLQWK